MHERIKSGTLVAPPWALSGITASAIPSNCEIASHLYLIYLDFFLMPQSHFIVAMPRVPIPESTMPYAY